MSELAKDRIDLRISREKKEFIKYASELSGFKSLSEFVTFVVYSEAKKVVKENDTIVKTLEDKKVFMNTLLNPPSPNAKLLEAQKTFKNHLKNDGLFNNASG